VAAKQHSFVPFSLTIRLLYSRWKPHCVHYRRSRAGTRSAVDQVKKRRDPPVPVNEPRPSTLQCASTAAINGKVHQITGHEGPGVEYMYRSTLSLTSALDGEVGQRHAPATLPPGITRYTLYCRLGGPQSRSGRVRKILPPPGLDRRTVQPVASRYTD
jgi:hypothetical protein